MYKEEIYYKIQIKNMLFFAEIVKTINDSARRILEKELDNCENYSKYK